MQERLASIRRYKNISQKKMADMLGITYETYSNKELGKSEFKASEMFMIASFFEMKIDEIFLPPNFIKHEVDSKNVI